MKNRIVQALLTALLISSMIVSPVFATTLEDMQKNKDQAETEASSLQEQLTQTLDKIDTLEADLDKKQEEVEKAGDDLEEAAAKQTEQYESMKLRIKYMYEEGNSRPSWRARKPLLQLHWKISSLRLHSWIRVFRMR